MAETIYMITTKDKFELPIAVAGSAAELARMLGLNLNSVYTAISKHHRGYYKIEINDDPVEETNG